MVVTYCTADDVARLLQTEPFGTTTTPTTAQVEKIINRKEDRIDQKLNHGWREKTSKLLFISPSFIDLRNGVRFDLPNYAIKTLTNGTDTLEVWDGNNYIDFLADRTEGRDNDYWLDEELGVLYIRRDVQTSAKKAIRIQFRYGETTVSGDIEDLCVLLAAKDVLTMYPRNIRFDDDGGSAAKNSQQKTEDFDSQIKELWNVLSNIGTF